MFRKMMAAALMVTVAMAAPPAGAEIEKTAGVGEAGCNGVCLHWWPKLTIPKGWKQDLAFSRENNVNLIVPNEDPGNVGIYAGAFDDPQSKSVADFLQGDRETFAKNHPGMKVLDGPVFATADGHKLPSLDFQPAGKGNWDLTAYGEETDKDGNHYFTTFTLSAPTKALRDKYQPVFIQVLAAYRR
ncbi:MAG TPA: hypothetical protein VG839_04155 [Asticcacaulis sp.]|nr:hypothetical protein [Asticcacaulis sp.]